ncbi:MAG TPA: hypothetical protein VFM02_03670 [Candidatus Paceibacterota bacterium]|nr:hypothetical protein [Candidatus Paceibacterota bacterium]
MSKDKWKSHDDGTKTKEWSVTKNGIREDHTLTDAAGGSKENHSHVIVRNDPGGRKTAHGIPKKNNR